MTWAADLAVVPGAVCAVVAAVAGLFVPALVGRIPEPDEPADDKELYADIARTPGLALRGAVTAGAVAGTTGLALGWDAALPALVYLAVVGVALAVVDWRTRLLPTKVVRPSYVVVALLLLAGAAPSGDLALVLRAGAGLVVARGLFWLMWLIYPKGMGWGDVRLSGVLGMALGAVGWGALLLGVYAGFLLGALLGGVLALLKVVDRKAYPFGPFMLAGAWLGVLLGEPLARAYTGTL